MTEKMYWYWFISLLKLTRKQQHDILEICFSPKEFFVLREEVAAKFLTKKQLEVYRSSKNVDEIKKSYARLQKEEILFHLVDEARYPQKLKDIIDPPYGIFHKGMEIQSPLSIAIVGSRKPSLYGIEMAEYFAKYFARKGVTVVSGLALGIDARAHIGAIKGNGTTIGVLGCGINKVYPYNHRILYEEVLKQGCIYSEYGLDEKPLAYHFPQRNRIISGLCDGVLVIEAKKKSGSLITTDCALDQNKDVFAIPGNINSELSHGCNQLIMQGAKLVEKPEDVLEEYSNFMTNQEKVSQFTKKGLDGQEKMVYDTLSFVPKHLNEINFNVKLSIPDLMEVLYYLEKKDYIEQTARNYYIKKLL